LKNKRIDIYLTEADYRKVKIYAEAVLRPMGNLAKYALFRYMKQYPVERARKKQKS